jgi:DNA-binding transcriptional LysR family regulator
MSKKLLSPGGLSLERLAAFLEISDAEGISRAAKGSSSKQSQLSRQLSELETFFGTKLALRGHSTLFTLTEAGRRLKAIASQNFASLDELRQTGKNSPVVIRIGAGESLLTWLVIPVLAALPTARGVSFRLLNRRSVDILDEVREGSIELGFVRRESVSDLTTEALGKIEMMLVKPRALIAGSEAEAPIAAMDNSIGRDEGEPRQEGSLPGVVVYRCTSYHQMAELVRRGKCAAVLPRFMATEFRGPRFTLEPIRVRGSVPILAVSNPRVLGLRPKAAIAITQICVGCRKLL